MKISINGKEYGLHWGMPCLAEMCDILDCTIETCTEYIIGGGEHTGFERQKFTATSILCAIRHYARLNREETPDLTIDDTLNYCDITPPETFALVRNDFLGSMLNGRSIADMLGIALPVAGSEKKSQSASPKKSSSSTKLATSRGK